MPGRDGSLPEHGRRSGERRPPPHAPGVPPQQLRLSEGGTHWTGTLSLGGHLRVGVCSSSSPPPPAAPPRQNTCSQGQQQPTLFLLFLLGIFLPLLRFNWNIQARRHAPRGVPGGARGHIQTDGTAALIPVLLVGLPPLLWRSSSGLAVGRRYDEPLLCPVKTLQTLGYRDRRLLRLKSGLRATAELCLSPETLPGLLS